MTLKFCDGFDSYAATADLLKKWRLANTPWTWSSAAGRFGGGAAVSTGSVGGGQLASQIAFAIPGGASQGPAFQFYFKISAVPAALSQFFACYGATGALGGEVRIGTSGQIVMWATGATMAALPSTPNVCDNQWHHVEVLFQGSSFGGTVTASVYIDGVSAGSTSNANGTFSVGYFAFNSINGVTATVDDLILWDSSAAPFTAFPLGPRQITVTRPASDGVVQFGTVVGGTGTHASAVNETVPDGDTSYVQDSTFGNQDLLNMGALGYTPTTINAAMANVYVENPSGGTTNTSGICKSSATTSVAAAAVTPLLYQTLQFAFVTDPNGSIAWTAANLNAAQFGFKTQ
jgi:hypothetical protein